MVRKWDTRVFRHLLKLSISRKEQQRAECLSRLLQEYSQDYAAHRDRLGGKIKAIEALLAEISDQTAASMAIKIAEILDNSRSHFWAFSIPNARFADGQTGLTKPWN